MSVYSKIGSATIDAWQDTHQETLEVCDAVARDFWAICNKWARVAETEVGGWIKLQAGWWSCFVWLPTASKANPETLTTKDLRVETQAFQGTGGTSEHSQSHGFSPAFLDTQTGIIHPCCQANGKPAVMHLLDGLPGELVLARSPSGRVLTAKGSLIAGFIKDNRFYTREEAAKEIMQISQNTRDLV